MQLVKFNPLRDLLQLERDIDSMLKNGWSLAPTFTEMSTIDMYEENGKLVTEVTLPNFKKDEVKVTTDEHGLEITAEHKEKQEKKEAKKRHYLLHESRRSYWRRITLPMEAKPAEATAKYIDGKLAVTMPFAKREKAKAVSVK